MALKSPGKAASLGSGAAFGVSIVGGFVGSWVEHQWDTIVISWEMAALFVCVLVTFGGFFVGAIAGMIRRIGRGTVVGAILLGACLAGISLTNGSPQGVAIWSIIVGICSGAAAGAVGGAIGKWSVER
jgi:hypothetical protein